MKTGITIPVTFLVACLATTAQAANCTSEVQRCTNALRKLGYDAHCTGGLVTGAQNQAEEQKVAGTLMKECKKLPVIGTH